MTDSTEAVGPGPLARKPSKSAAATWLKQALAAERAGMMLFMEHRHRELVVEFLSMAGEVEECADEQGTASDTDVSNLERPRVLDAHRPSCESAKQEMPETPEDVESTSASARPSTSALSRSASSKKLSAMKKSLGVGNLAEEVDYSRPWSHRLVTKPTFEAVVASVIMTNVLIMAAQIQYQGLQVGYMLEYRWYEEEAQDVWGGATVVFDILDYLFGTIYVVELLLKIHAFRRDWVRDLWNWFDAIIVAFWLVEKPLQDVLVLPADATLLRTARLFKLLRLVKVIKTLHGFDSLYLLVTTLKGSLQILGWSCVLLFMVQMLIAFVVFFILEEAYFHNPTYPIEERRRVFEYFGSFSRAMLSMFEMSLANWPPVCRLLVESVNEWFMLFFVAHKLTIGFAVIGVINGVFMQETFKAASSDDSIMMRQKEREIKMYTEKMSRLFFAADESGHGHIDIEAFQRIMGDREIVTWLASMEIPVRDPESLFELLDSSKAGYLTADSMAKGALKLRGGAKSVDVLALKRQLHDIEEMLAEVARGKSLKRQPTHASEESSRWQWQSSIRDADS